MRSRQAARASSFRLRPGAKACAGGVHRGRDAVDIGFDHLADDCAIDRREGGALCAGLLLAVDQRRGVDGLRRRRNRRDAVFDRISSPNSKPGASLRSGM